jgi:hypothetical protein
MVALVPVRITDEEATELLLLTGSNGESLMLVVGNDFLIPCESNRWAYLAVARMRLA